MAKEPKAPKEPLDPSNMSRRRQIIETFKMTRQVDRAAGWWMLGAFLLFGAIGFGIFWILVTIFTGGLGIVLWLIWPRHNELVSVDRYLECSACNARV